MTNDDNDVLELWVNVSGYLYHNWKGLDIPGSQKITENPIKSELHYCRKV